MSTFPNAAAWGYPVTKAAQNLPASTTATLFTVAGGAVLVQAIFGVVTTAIQNQACTLALGSAPTSGTASNTSIATAGSIINMGIGTFYVPQWASGVSAAPAIANNVETVPLPAGTTSFLAYTGTITWTTSATNTGQMKWFLYYVPVDSAATVA